MWAPVPRSLYVHIPFCRHRCGYCNFSIVANRDDLVERVLTAIDHELQSLELPRIETLFVGGGTPTHLTVIQLQRLIQILTQRLQFDEAAEFSVEANPEDITPEKLAVLVNSGVNRLSLGVQSFNSAKLQTLERGHSGEDAARAIELAASFVPNVSLDLIFAAPGENARVWREDLGTALSLPIKHLSTYMLTFEKGTSFWNRREKGLLHGAGEDIELQMYEAAREMIQASAMDHYEISNFAQPGFRCRHNLAYWRGQSWYAVGPGAARFVAGRREVNHRSTTTYLKRSEANLSLVAESEAISQEQFGRELAAFGVRLIDGIDTQQTLTQTGVDIRSLCEPVIQRMVASQLLFDDGQRLRLSERGILFADTVAAEFLSA